MLKAIVLGAAAGGGVPQWNCNCPICNTARTEPAIAATQASIAISCDDRHWFLINASLDIRQQINATPQLHPAGDAIRHSPIAGIFLTNGEVDAVAGLLSLREGSPYSIYAHPKVLSVLEENSIFNVLNPAVVARRPIDVDQPFRPLLPDGTPSGLEVTAFHVPGKPAWYLEGLQGAERTEAEGDTIGLSVRGLEGGELVFLAACAEITDELMARIDGASLLFFDGTLWRDDEMVTAGMGQKTGQRMGHVSISDEGGPMRKLAGLNLGKKVFLHINNSNPVLLPGSPERRQAEQFGWHIAHDGMELTT